MNDIKREVLFVFQRDKPFMIILESGFLISGGKAIFLIILKDNCQGPFLKYTNCVLVGEE